MLEKMIDFPGDVVSLSTESQARPSPSLLYPPSALPRLRPSPLLSPFMGGGGGTNQWSQRPRFLRNKKREGAQGGLSVLP